MQFMVYESEHRFRLPQRYYIDVWNSGVIEKETRHYIVRVYESLEKSDRIDIIHMREVGTFQVPQGSSAKVFLEQVKEGIEKLVKEKP